MTTLLEVLRGFYAPCICINDGATDWSPESLIDFYLGSDEGEDMLENDAWIFNGKIHTEDFGTIGKVLHGEWNDNDEFEENE